MAPLKAAAGGQSHDGSGLRIAIVHSRWNATIVDSLVQGTREGLAAAGVKEPNIVVQDVPGSWELPMGVQRMFAASQIQASSSANITAGDLLGGTTAAAGTTPDSGDKGGPFDAIIAIGCLIKGETMHFEYIADAASQGLMRVQLDTGTPVVFGLLTVLSEEQAKARAGLDGKGSNLGHEWGEAAVELGTKRKVWADGKFL